MSNLMKRVSNWVTSTPFWKAVFRHGYEDTARNRSLTTFSNVLYHLHPVKTRRESIKIRYTWCMGGTSLLLFVILSVAEDPLSCVAIGSGRCLEEFEVLKRVLVSFGSTF